MIVMISPAKSSFFYFAVIASQDPSMFNEKGESLACLSTSSSEDDKISNFLLCPPIQSSS